MGLFDKCPERQRNKNKKCCDKIKTSACCWDQAAERNFSRLWDKFSDLVWYLFKFCFEGVEKMTELFCPQDRPRLFWSHVQVFPWSETKQGCRDGQPVAQPPLGSADAAARVVGAAQTQTCRYKLVARGQLTQVRIYGFGAVSTWLRGPATISVTSLEKTRLFAIRTNFWMARTSSSFRAQHTNTDTTYCWKLDANN